MIACEQKRRRRKTFCACGQIVASNTSKALQERGRNLKRTETKNENKSKNFNLNAKVTGSTRVAHNKKSTSNDYLKSPCP